MTSRSCATAWSCCSVSSTASRSLPSPQNGEEAIRLAADHNVDVVLMDLRMPRIDGVEATRTLRAKRPDIHVLVLTTYADDQSLIPALDAGANGYLTKNTDADTIAAAIRTVHAGGTHLGSDIQQRLVEARHRAHPNTVRHPPRRPHATRSRSAEPDCRRAIQPRNRGATLRQPCHRENPHQQDLLQDPLPRPRPTRHLCLPPPTRITATPVTTLQ